MTRSTTTAPRTGRTWKATAAVGAAVALLAAGGATFAEWSDSEDLGATAIQSGTLALTATPDQGVWTNIEGNNVTARIQDGSYRIVPGDQLTFADSVLVTATGDLLTATVSATPPTVTGEHATELVDRLTANTEMTIDGVTVDGLSTRVSAADEDQVLDVTVTLTFDSATSGLMAQGQNVDLGATTITLEQNAVTADGNA